MSDNLRHKNNLFNKSIRKFILDFPDLKYNGSHVICLVCNKRLFCWKRQMFHQHINSPTHRYKKSSNTPYAKFLFKLVFTLNACNLSLATVQKQPFRDFCEKYVRWKLPGPTTLQRYLPRERERIENNIIAQTSNQKIWLAIEENMDSKRNSIANIIIRTMNPVEPSPPYLIASKRLQECTGEKIEMLVLDSLQKFQISTEQVLMFVTTMGSSMVCAGHLLKNVCPYLIHVMCLVHTLHQVADTIRNFYPDVDALIAQTGAVFCKSPKRIRKFHEECPNIPQPSEPVLITQGGVWLQAAFYYHQHFQKIKSVVLKFDAKEAVTIKESQIKFKDAQIEADLQTIYNNYQVIANAIKKLENSSLSLAESLKIIDGVHTMLQSLNDEKSVCVIEQWNCGLRKNVDFAKLKQICSDSVPRDPLCSFAEYFTYANITSLDVERLFSLYKNIFSSLRTSSKEWTVETYVMMQMFNLAHPNS